MSSGIETEPCRKLWPHQQELGLDLQQRFRDLHALWHMNIEADRVETTMLCMRSEDHDDVET